jgi:hypothetical protein
MSVPPDFEDVLGESLDVIDRELAREAVPLRDRPLRAARDFVTFCVIRVGIGGEESEPGKFLDYMASDWFKAIYARTIGWYASRYGEAVGGDPDKIVNGCILVLGTPFVMRIPVVTRRPGTPGETIWVCYPKEVEDDEDPLDWVVSGPNLRELPRGDGLKARRLATEVANAVRSIATSIMPIEQPTPRVAGLRDAILPHLDRAATMIAHDRPEERKHAQWDLQMACELALKLLAEQRAGTFKETHDLYYLYDHLPEGPVPFERTLLKQIPSWERMVEWRYGGGLPITAIETFARYRATLKIVAGVANVTKRKIRIGGGRIEIRRAPFLHEDPDMFLPRRKTVAGHDEE